MTFPASLPPLVPVPLTAEDFAPFGDVIEADHDRSHLINEGRTRRYHALATAAPGEGGEAILSIFRGTPWPAPVTIRMLERHPLGTQAFVPMERHPWLVVVAEAPRAEACRCFLARGDQGIQIARGVWHHPLLVLQPSQDFLVVDRAGAGNNLEEVWFPEGETVTLAPV
ncbi:ureidoglycolate lyase [Stappia stellulata]|uniref:ureidoglycolate lyase n=1 Tax=Stappia stellulata TaxID=71235 RepID=UPI001CD69140|nr:ureidoglycolate lyase [Stappia stellulata]MCA1242821.1 ureidoglycolate lyase [Stappia stellulata]